MKYMAYTSVASKQELSIFTQNHWSILSTQAHAANLLPHPTIIIGALQMK